MTYRLMKEVFYISIHHMNALLIMLAINLIIYLKAKKTPLLYAFLGLQGTIALWMVAKILKTVSPNVTLRWSFVVLQYLAICLMELAFIDFAFEYAFGKKAPKIWRRLLQVVATTQFLVILTNPLHYQFYTSFTFRRDYFGPLFYVHMAILYSVILISSIICGRHLRATIKNRLQLLLVSVGILIPMVINVLYIAGILRRWLKSMGFEVTFDFTPMALGLSLLIFVTAIFKYDLLDIMPLYKEEIIKRVGTAIFVTDVNKGLIASNQAADELFGDLSEEATSDIIAYITKRYPSSQSLVNFFEFSLEEAVIPIHDSYYKCRMQQCYDRKGREIGRRYSAYNVTYYEELQTNLMVRNDVLSESIAQLESRIDMTLELSRIATRNYFARELHDILGHSMTLTIKLLEIAGISYEEDPALSRYQLEEAARVTSKGYVDLKASIHDHLNAQYDLVGLKRDIQKIVKVLEVAGVACEIHMNTQQGLLSEEESQMIQRLCQEGVTNALKHGHASRVKIQMIFKKEGNQLLVLNDGHKPEDIVFGNGLKGLKSRVEQLGGRLSVTHKENWFGLQVDY